MFYYYGAKNQLARYYQYPIFDTIIEPFAGSASYSIYHLNKNPKLNSILIEKDKRVFDLWKYLIEANIKDILNYPTPKIGEYTADFFIMTCAVSNSISKCKKLKFTDRINRVFQIQKNRIIKLQHIKKQIHIIHSNYTETENTKATWFIDPPYQIINTNPNTIFPNGNGYSKTCNSDCLDYKKLRDWSKNRNGQIIVCEKNGANWMEFQPLKENKTSLNKKYKEVVWYNL